MWARRVFTPNAGLYYSRVILIFSVLNYVFAQFLKLIFHLCHTVTEPNGCASHAYTFASPLPLPPPPQIHTTWCHRHGIAYPWMHTPASLQPRGKVRYSSLQYRRESLGIAIADRDRG